MAEGKAYIFLNFVLAKSIAGTFVEYTILWKSKCNSAVTMLLAMCNAIFRELVSVGVNKSHADFSFFPSLKHIHKYVNVVPLLSWYLEGSLLYLTYEHNSNQGYFCHQHIVNTVYNTVKLIKQNQYINTYAVVHII